MINFLADYFHHPFKLTANEQAYIASADYKINYSHTRISDDELYINPHALLFESEKRKVKAECFEYNGHTVFFAASGDLHFDLFAGIFFLLSRYEEYLPHEKDQYGRFSHKSSVAFQEGFLDKPLINIWLDDFKQLLEKRFRGLELFTHQFRFIPTYDIDIAWSYRNKGFKRNFWPLVRDIFEGRWRQANERIKVLKGKLPDPYDSFEWIDLLHQQYNLTPVYFFLVAREAGVYDKNISIDNPEFQALIQSIAQKYPLGLHPSWASGDERSLFPKERKWLEKLTHRNIIASRQHYLRFMLPYTYQFLMGQGISHEYSMGYGTVNGFRASIASPFYWYDLQKEESTNLLVYPFCFMDANAYFEEERTPAEALEELLHYYNSVKSVNGTLITLWHNQFLGTGKEFEGWRQTYEQFVAAVAK
ncbi:polysaccharide deacetylase family protein [Paraflavisolibacter sp. H34]|uniref:polysaccharide deacetylase family protein n=1 Tax=Huijunlia imazamoxiresistens TaxID=3127457 RepID=UPI003015F2EC